MKTYRGAITLLASGLIAILATTGVGDAKTASAAFDPAQACDSLSSATVPASQIGYSLP